jgi:23S rRNA (uracil1939-C5)-methyltransferase
MAAIDSARRQAQTHETYIAGEVGAQLGDVLARQPGAETTVLLDPPTEGLASRVTDLLLGAASAELLYVSCNPGTLARDLAALASAYELIAVTPIDMFPQTAEIEVIAHLRLRGSAGV